MKTCGAKTKHDGTPCERSPVRGRSRCRLHGGKTLVGSACSHYRHGRYSTYVPERLRARYEQAEDDAELLSLRGEIALVDARLIDLLSRVDSGESGRLWVNLKKAHEEFTTAKRGEDVGRMQLTLARVEYLIDSAVQDHAAWAEIGALIEQRRKLAESEAKRLITLQQMLTAAEAMTIVHRIIDIVTRHVADKQALRDIVVDMRALAEATSGHPVCEETPDV